MDNSRFARWWLLVRIFGALGCSACCGSNQAAETSGLITETAALRVASRAEYLFAITSVLLPQPESCLQYAKLVYGAPEEVVYIDCLGVRQGAPPRLVHVVAEREVRRVLEVEGLAAALKVNRRRTERVVEGSDYYLFKTLWLAMVQGAGSRQQFSFDDPGEYHFAVCAWMPGCVGALTTRRPAGTLRGDFVNLGDMLAFAVDSTTPDVWLVRARESAKAMLRTLKVELLDASTDK